MLKNNGHSRDTISGAISGGGSTVTSIIAGTGISIDQSTGAVTITYAGSPVRQQSGATYTFAASDVGKYVQFTDAAPTVTIDTNANVPMPANAEINFEATGGTVTVAAAGGVTLNSPGGKVSSSDQFVALTLKRTATDVWTLIGSLA